MIKVLRKNQKGLWIVIALLCIPFVFYFSNSDVGSLSGPNDIGKIYGEPVSTVELQRSARLFNLARDVGMFTLLQDMVGNAQTQDEAYMEFTWNRLILRHEAERLGIHPVSYEVANVIRGLQPFRSDAGFDPRKYDEFVKTALPAMGFGDAQLEEIASDQLRLERLKQVIGTGVQISPSESKETYERAYGKLTVAVGRLRSEDFGKDVQVSEDEIAKYYETNKAELNSEEKRKVNFVALGLKDEQKALTGRERTDALQKQADRANDFSQALLEKGAQFAEVARKFELPVQSSSAFTRAAPDPVLAVAPQLSTSAFQLTPEQPNSDVVQSADTFYVVHLEAVEPARALSLEEARPKIVESVKSRRVRELITAKGTEAVAKIRAAVQTGTAPEQAIQEAGLQAEKLPPFALADAPQTSVEPDKPPVSQAPDLNMIKGAVAELAPKEVSNFTPTPAGGVVAILEQREVPNAGPMEQTRSSFDDRLLRNRTEIAFREWLEERRREAGVASKEPGMVTDMLPANGNG